MLIAVYLRHISDPQPAPRLQWVPLEIPGEVLPAVNDILDVPDHGERLVIGYYIHRGRPPGVITREGDWDGQSPDPLTQYVTVPGIPSAEALGDIG